MSVERNRQLARRKRQLRIRRKVQGTAQRPRLCVTKTAQHMYAQVIDDTAGHTLIAASTREGNVSDEQGRTATVQAAKKVGETIGRRAVEQGISDVVFDRAGWPYHGRVKAVADGAREGGLSL